MIIYVRSACVLFYREPLLSLVLFINFLFSYVLFVEGSEGERGWIGVAITCSRIGDKK